MGCNLSAVKLSSPSHAVKSSSLCANHDVPGDQSPLKLCIPDEVILCCFCFSPVLLVCAQGKALRLLETPWRLPSAIYELG